jgi:hypothetical protein
MGLAESNLRIKEVALKVAVMGRTVAENLFN